MEQSDIIIIGAGGVGCAVARELSRYQLNVIVLEKECDVAAGASGRNSAVVHAGFNNKPGSLMARLCVEGNRDFENLCNEIGVPFKNTGKVLVAFDVCDVKTLEKLVEQGNENGCRDLRLLDSKEIKRIIPGCNAIGGMLSPHTSIFNPFEYCIALAENASSNGVRFLFNKEVIQIEKRRDNFFVKTKGADEFQCKVLINCAGLYSDKISSMLGINYYHIYPCRGEYLILDKVADKLMSIPIYPAPKAGIGGLGVHITPTIEGNLIIGPSAEYVDDKDDYSCTSSIMNKLFREAKILLPSIEKKNIIGAYSGIRTKQTPPSIGGFNDFVIKEEEECSGFINLVGIESPGLTASVPIARKVAEIVGRIININKKKTFLSHRSKIVHLRDYSKEEQEKLIKEDKEYGEIVCRCQMVSKKEIRNAIENPLGVTSLCSIKYRAWAMTGRCNGGYCLTRIIDILINNYGMKPKDIDYRGRGSEMFVGVVK